MSEQWGLGKVIVAGIFSFFGGYMTYKIAKSDAKGMKEIGTEVTKDVLKNAGKKIVSSI